MKMLVTGGAGFIGTNFVLRTAETRPDWQVTVLDALTYAGNRANLAAVADRVELRRRASSPTPTLVDRLVADTDVVVHFAAESHNDNSLDDPWPFVETNIIGTYRLLEAVRRHGVRLHHVSTDEVYGDLELDDPERFTEQTPFNPSSPVLRVQGVGATCWCAPGSARSASRRRCRTARTTTGRTSTSRSSSRARSPTSCRASSRSSTARATNVRDWIHVDDHNDAVVAIIEQGRLGETYLIGADGERNNREIVELLLELHGQAGRLVRPRQRPAGARPALRDRLGQAAGRDRLGAAATPTSGPAWSRPSPGTASTRTGGGPRRRAPRRPTSASAADRRTRHDSFATFGSLDTPARPACRPVGTSRTIFRDVTPSRASTVRRDQAGARRRRSAAGDGCRGPAVDGGQRRRGRRGRRPARARTLGEHRRRPAARRPAATAARQRGQPRPRPSARSASVHSQSAR